MAASAGYRSDSVLVGRDHELEAMRAALEADGPDAAGTVFVHGEAGMGKTSLVATALARFHDRAPDAVIARGTCLPMMALTVPLIGIRSALHALSSPRASGAELPPLPDLDAGSGRTPVDIDQWVDEVTRGRGLVIAIDDLQWADPETLDTLLYLIAGPAARRLTLIATIRTTVLADTTIDRWSADARRLPRTQTVELGPLDRAATAEQMAAVLGWPPDQSLIEEVFAKTRGHPYLTELTIGGLPAGATHLPSELPETVTGAVLGTVDLLSAEARLLLNPLAIAGHPLAPAALARLLVAGGIATSDRPIESDVAEAVRLGVIVEDRGTIWFRHPLTAELVESALPEADRRRWHDVLARFEAHLRPAPGTELDHALRLADHHHATGDARRSYDSALGAAGIAREHGAHDHELRLLTRALALRERAADPDDSHHDLLHRARRAAEDAGALDEELAVVDEILARRELTDLVRAEFEVRRLWLRTVTQREPLHQDTAQDVIRLTSRYPASWQHGFALATSVHSVLASGANVDPATVRVADASLSIARRTGDPLTLAYALTASAEVQRELGRFALARELAAEAQAASLAAHAWVCFNESVFTEAETAGPWLSDQFVRALQSGHRAIAAAGAPHRFVAWIAALEADSWLTIGEWRECGAVLRSILQHDPGLYSGTSARFTAARLAVLQGRLAEAEAHVARIDELIDEHRQFVGFGLHALRARIRLLAGDPAGAYAAARAAVDMGHPLEQAEWLLPLAARSLADLLDRARDAHQDESTLIETLDELTDRHPDVISPMPAAEYAHDPKIAALRCLYRAEVDRARRSIDESSSWASAADALGRASLPWDEAYACQRWAESLLRGAGGARRVGAARAALRRGFTTAERLRAAPVLDALHRLADAAGIRFDDDTFRGPPRGSAASVAAVSSHPRLHAATEREREVLERIVAGDTYAEIAAALFISEKTVSAHVSHLLTKTGTTNRVELAQLATTGTFSGS